jgi:hypothetical protein
LALIQGADKKRTVIIDNGFDEVLIYDALSSNLKILEDSEKIRFVYAGQLTYRDPTCLLEIIRDSEKLKHSVEFIYVGDKSKWFEPFHDEKWLIELGPRTYFETMLVLKSCDYGLIFTEGYQFESTTKIFDYMGMGLQIIIISDNDIEQSAMADYARLYKNAQIIKNNKGEIAEYLFSKAFGRGSKLKCYDNSFSRENGLKKLITAINELTENKCIQ